MGEMVHDDDGTGRHGQPACRSRHCLIMAQSCAIVKLPLTTRGVAANFFYVGRAVDIMETKSKKQRSAVPGAPRSKSDDEKRHKALQDEVRKFAEGIEKALGTIKQRNRRDKADLKEQLSDVNEKLIARFDQLERRILEQQRQHISEVNKKFDTIKETMNTIETLSDTILQIVNIGNSDKHSGYPSPSARLAEDHRIPVDGNAVRAVFKSSTP